MHSPLVAVVILNYNGAEFLQKFLPSVCSSSYPNKKIIVADNASSDNSLDILGTNFTSVGIIKLEKNYGFADGYNKALAQVEADYYVLLNSDVEVTSGWIEPIIELMEDDKSIAACQPKLLAFDNKKQFEYAGACGGWIDFLGYPFARGRVFDFCEIDAGQYDETQPVFWATGAAMFVKSFIWKEVGGLDGFFFAHQEEIDFCWRLQRAGYKVYCCPKSVVYHVGGGTLPKTNVRKTFLNFRNNNIMLCKNLPTREKTWKLPLRILLDIVFALKTLLQGDGASLKAVWQAHIALVKWIFMKKDDKAFTEKKGYSVYGMTKKLIIWEYFIKKKKRFEEIVKN